MALQPVEDIIKNHRSKGIAFVDTTFPPGHKSLYLNGKKPLENSRNPKIDNEIQWIRSKYIYFGSQTSVDASNDLWKVAENPQSSDIEQGYLGNCWFIASLALVADKKEILDRILVTKEANPEGIYVIQIFRDGTWKNVLVDDCFPCVRNRLLYARSKKRELWISLIEKAMAKMYGCYEALSGGSPFDGLTALTGYSSENIKWDLPDNQEAIDFDIIWAQLLSSFMAGFIIGATCGKTYGPKWKKEFYDNMGLKSNHCYSVQEVISVDSKRMLKLRNPWGKFSWKGDWNENSALWTSRMREALSYSQDSEGTFWMSYEDFLRYFADVYVCKLRLKWPEENMRDIFVSHGNGSVYPVYRVQVNIATEIDATIFQFNEGDNSNMGLVDLGLVLIQDRPISNSNSCSTTDSYLGDIVGYCEPRLKSSVNFNCFVPPGMYFLVPIALLPMSNHSYPNFHIKVYSAQKLYCKKVVLDKYLVPDVLMILARNHSIPAQMMTDVQLYTLGNQSNIHVFICENRSERFIQITWTKQIISGSVSTVATKLQSTRGSNVVNDIIPPMHRQVINVTYSTQAIQYQWEMQTVNLSDLQSKGTAYHEPEVDPEFKNLHMCRAMI